jgi:hypothetical protein
MRRRLRSICFWLTLAATTTHWPVACDAQSSPDKNLVALELIENPTFFPEKINYKRTKIIEGKKQYIDTEANILASTNFFSEGDCKKLSKVQFLSIAKTRKNFVAINTFVLPGGQGQLNVLAIRPGRYVPIRNGSPDFC